MDTRREYDIPGFMRYETRRVSCRSFTGENGFTGVGCFLRNINLFRQIVRMMHIATFELTIRCSRDRFDYEK